MLNSSPSRANPISVAYAAAFEQENSLTSAKNLARAIYSLNGDLFTDSADASAFFHLAHLLLDQIDLAEEQREIITSTCHPYVYPAEAAATEAWRGAAA